MTCLIVMSGRAQNRDYLRSMNDVSWWVTDGHRVSAPKLLLVWAQHSPPYRPKCTTLSAVPSEVLVQPWVPYPVAGYSEGSSILLVRLVLNGS